MYDYCTQKTTILYNKPKKMKVTVLVEKLLMNPNNS